MVSAFEVWGPRGGTALLSRGSGMSSQAARVSASGDEVTYPSENCVPHGESVSVLWLWMVLGGGSPQGVRTSTKFLAKRLGTVQSCAIGELRRDEGSASSAFLTADGIEERAPSKPSRIRSRRTVARDRRPRVHSRPATMRSAPLTARVPTKKASRGARRRTESSRIRFCWFLGRVGPSTSFNCSICASVPGDDAGSPGTGRTRRRCREVLRQGFNVLPCRR